MIQATHIKNIKIHVIRTPDALHLMKTYFNGPKCRSVYFINAHCFNIAQKNEDYFRIINNADLVLNDGSGIRIASWLHGINLLENMNGTDFIPAVIKLATKEQLPVYFLGATKENIELAVGNVLKSVSGVKIGGYHHGFFNASQDDDIINQINKSRAGILIVGMGVPKQELWIAKNQEKFTHVKVAIAGGAIIDFLSGKIKRAPNWMRAIGIEWIFRLIQEPKRLTKRYLIGNPVFLFSIIKHRCLKKR